MTSWIEKTPTATTEPTKRANSPMLSQESVDQQSPSEVTLTTQCWSPIYAPTRSGSLDDYQASKIPKCWEYACSTNRTGLENTKKWCNNWDELMQPPTQWDGTSGTRETPTVGKTQISCGSQREGPRGWPMEKLPKRTIQRRTAPQRAKSFPLRLQNKQRRNRNCYPSAKRKYNARTRWTRSIIPAGTTIKWDEEQSGLLETMGILAQCVLWRCSEQRITTKIR